MFLLVGFTGILVWGGVNRTLAKTNKEKFESLENHQDAGHQITGKGNQEQNHGRTNPEDRSIQNSDGGNDNGGHGDVGAIRVATSLSQIHLKNQSVEILNCHDPVLFIYNTPPLSSL